MHLLGLDKHFMPRHLISDFRARDQAAKTKQKLNFDRLYGAKPLPLLEPGNSVSNMTNLTKLGGLGELGGQHHGAHGLGVVEGGQVGEGQRRALCPVAVEVLEGRKIS